MGGPVYYTGNGATDTSRGFVQVRPRPSAACHGLCMRATLAMLIDRLHRPRPVPTAHAAAVE